jgi:N-acetylmuramoyl-L-alanine amidase
MNGVIAAILSVMIGSAAAIGNADCSSIIKEAQRIEQQNAAKEEAAGYVIAIDAGHQAHGNFGQEPIGPGASTMKTKVAGGTSGTTSGVPEYQLTLDVSLKLRDALEEKGYQVVMIRETNDVDITNSERAQIANEADADAFIRVHANGSDSASANGAMTICQTSSNPYNSEYYEDSKRLSELVLDAYTEATGIRKERVWETDTMSGINWCMVPVTIIELGYMTNPEEDMKMQDEEFQNTMVEGIVAGIETYLDEKKAEEPDEVSTAESANTGSTLNPEHAEVDEQAAHEKEAQASRDILASTIFTPARKVDRSAKTVRNLIDSAGKGVLDRRHQELLAKTSAEMQALQEALEAEIGRLGGKWSLYLKRLDTDQVIGVHADEKMVAASLIKLFVAGEFFRQTDENMLDIEKYGRLPDAMINVSDNGAANTLINAVGMDNVNKFAQEHGFTETEINRRMLENNGTENYTSAKDCGVMLEQVLAGKYVNPKASERILQALKDQQRTGKIPAGIPSEVPTGNKTGELSYVDNDAAIVWAPSCTYILCIMSSDAGGRISEIVRLSSMVYHAIGE